MDRNDELKKLLEDYNQYQLMEKLSQGEIIKIRELLPKLENAMRDHDIIKSIMKSIVVGAPILLAVWQIIERIQR